MRSNINTILEGLNQSRIFESTSISGNVKDLISNSYLKDKEGFIDWVESHFTDGEDNQDVDSCNLKSIKIVKVEPVIRKGYGVNDPKHPEYKELGGLPAYKVTMKVQGSISYSNKEDDLNDEIVMYLKMNEWVGK